jgi:hypothetical protein
MVKVKVACKDVDKIPQKVLFEMEKLLYLIHFKVEKEGGGDGEGDEDGGDHPDLG